MPKENQKRGRRAEQKKRKHQEEEETHVQNNKRLKHSTDDVEASFIPLGDGAEQNGDGTLDNASGLPDMPFYGLLDEEEQEYFKRADDMLELNQFNDAEERRLFLENVWKEADGKELKLANSQSCSRLMERLILLSTPSQLKKLFQKFSGQFLYLVQHRFASHCCETLFLQSAPIVSKELAASTTEVPSDPNEIFVSMEDLFLYTLKELEGNLGYLMTDRFASHVLRVLLVVLSGEPLPSQTERSLLRSKKKDKIKAPVVEETTEASSEKRVVPELFSEALEKLIQNAVSALDTNTLRTLATHPTGNPMLQLLLRIELTHYGKSRAKDEDSILHKLLPDDPIKEGTESASFVNGLLYDAVGSRLLETIIKYAPAKIFKYLYKDLFKDRIESLARNDVASYVASTIMERLGKDDLREAAVKITPQLKNLVERGRTAVIKTLIERCLVRGVDVAIIASQLEEAYRGTNGFNIARILKLADAVPESSQEKPQTNGAATQAHPDRLHGSLLAQQMIAADGPLGDLIFEALVRLEKPLSIKIAKDPYASRTLQAAVISPHASIIFRRRMIQQYYGDIAELALDPAGSRFIDAIWEGTRGLAFIRERIAEELAESEASLRESYVGRAVWRNWRMDLYKRKRGDWVRQSRNEGGNDGFIPFPETKEANKKSKKQKTALELARERHAAAKAKKEGNAMGKGRNNEGLPNGEAAA